MEVQVVLKCLEKLLHRMQHFGQRIGSSSKGWGQFARILVCPNFKEIGNLPEKRAMVSLPYNPALKEFARILRPGLWGNLPEFQTLTISNFHKILNSNFFNVDIRLGDKSIEYFRCKYTVQCSMVNT